MRYSSVVLLLVVALWHQEVGVAADGRCPDGSPPILIDFDTLPSMEETTAGMMITDEWLSVGVSMTGRRRMKGSSFDPDQALRLFDSANPTGGDFDLGAPNEGCAGCESDDMSCPGVASEVWKESAATTNCKEQKNILIVDSGLAEPKDHKIGGDIIFVFTKPVSKVLSVGIMDIQPMEDPMQPGPSSSTYAVWDINGIRREKEKLMGLGDNSYQEVQPMYGSTRSDYPIGRLKLDLRGSAGITKLEYCLRGGRTETSETSETTETLDTTATTATETTTATSAIIETTEITSETETACDEQVDSIKICLAIDEPGSDSAKFATSLITQVEGRTMGRGQYGSILFDSAAESSSSLRGTATGRPTSMGTAVRLCERFLSSADPHRDTTNRQAMVVLTKGTPNSTSSKRSLLNAAMLAKQRDDILVIPVAIGSELDQDFLKMLATTGTDGEPLYIESSDIDLMQRQMDQLLSAIVCMRT